MILSRQGTTKVFLSEYGDVQLGLRLCSTQKSIQIFSLRDSIMSVSLIVKKENLKMIKCNLKTVLRR